MNRHLTHEQSCPGCHSGDLYSFFEMPDVPVNVGKTEPTREEASACKRGSISLFYCRRCGLVHNQQFSVDLVDFEPGYEVALHHSEIFRRFIEELAMRLIRDYQLQGKQVLDIGCGDGYFLKTLCRLAPCHGVGIDPTVESEKQFALGEGTTKFVRDFFGANYATSVNDLVTCQSVLEDIPSSNQFLQELRSMIGERKVPVYCEVFHGFRPFEEGEIWSIHFEQCNYFSLECLETIFRRSGFKIHQSGSCYQDQYIYVDAMAAECDDSPLPLHDVPKAILDFETKYQSSIAAWNRRLSQWSESQKTVAVWGSGGKGVNFLNSVDSQNLIERVFDINPDRQGTFIPGSAQKIVAPEELVHQKPDIIVLTNPLYESEIRQQVAAMEVPCEFFIA